MQSNKPIKKGQIEDFVSDSTVVYVGNTLTNYIPTSQKDSPLGVATLDSNGKILTTQLPSYVDDVIEAATLTALNALPASEKQTGKIYVALDTNKTYRWSGSTFVYITSGAVDSVNGQTGIVTLDYTHVGALSSGSSHYVGTTFIANNRASGAQTLTGVSIDGNSATATSTTKLSYYDKRTINPTDGFANGLRFGFTSWDNNNTAPYADYLHLRSYQDASGGNDNLVTFKKSGIGMRIWQQVYGSASAYTTYKDIAFTDGTNATGSWNINAATATKLETNRTISLSTGVTGTATSFDGSTNISIPVTALNADYLSSGTVPSARLSATWGAVVNSGPILTLGTVIGGSGYVDGIYNNIPLTGGTGAGATAIFTIAGGVVMNAILYDSGAGYVVGDNLSVASASVGGSGSGFSVPVSTVRTATIDIKNLEPRLRLQNTDTTLTAGQEIGSLLFGALDTSTNGRGDNVRLTAVAEGTSGGGTLQIWTTLNAGQPTIAAEFKGNKDFRLYDSTGYYYHAITNNPTANRTLNLPDGNVTLVPGTMVPTAGSTSNVDLNNKLLLNVNEFVSGGTTANSGLSVKYDATNGGIIQSYNSKNLYINGLGNNVGVGYTAGTAISAKVDVNGTVKATQFISSAVTGTAPLSVSSTTVVTNLNADLLDGKNSTDFVSNSYLSTRLIADANTPTVGSDFYFLSGTNKPSGVTDGALLHQSHSSPWATQMFSDWRTNKWYVRTKNSSTWGGWEQLWHSGNFTQPNIDNWNDAVTKLGAQNITGLKNFQNGFDINTHQFRSIDATNVIVSGGKNTFNNNLTNISDSAVGIGNNVFPAMNLQPYDPVTEPWNNKGYVGIGSDIFSQFTGATNYRPTHNAHDSWVGVGRLLGSGFLDGTNVTMLGTTNLHRNDVPYADCITVIGKGFSNGIKTRSDKTLDPNRVVISKNGINVHGMMSDVIGIGHESWVEDISQSVVIGSNLRPYSYVFNSLILGHNHVNMNYEGTTAQADMYLDSDVIIGMGVQKRTSRHAESHNLLIGMDGFYTMGSAPNPDYRPLVEGKFKDAEFQVNGIITAGHEAADTDKPNETNVPLVVGTLPSGVTFNSTDNTFTFDGSQVSTEFKIGDFIANPNISFYVEINAPIHTDGSWGSTINGVLDSGNTVAINWTTRYSFIPSVNSDFKLSTADSFQGTIKVIYKSTDLLGTGTLPNIQLKDSYENITTEIRGGKLENGHLGIGSNSGKFLHLGTNTVAIGTNAYSKGVISSNSVLLGANASKNNSYALNDVIIGYAAGENMTLGSGSNTLVGAQTLKDPLERITSTSTLGKDSLLRLQYGKENTAIGAGVAFTLLNGSNNFFGGYNSGLIKNGSGNVFLGSQAGGYGLMESTVNNTIVIGSGVSAEVPNNTTTIGGPSNTDNFFNGITHSHAFKVRGGTGSNVLLDNGTTTNTPTLSTIKTSRLGSFGTYNATQTQNIWSIDSTYNVSASTTTLGGMYGLGYSYISVGGSSIPSKHQIHFAENGVAKITMNMSDSQVRADTFLSRIPTGTAPFTVSSTTVVLNLNAERIGGYYEYQLIKTSGGSFTGAVYSTDIISVRADGVGSDPYGKISVTRGTASNFAYYGLTRSGSIGWSLGVDTNNNFIIGTGASGANIITSSLFSLSPGGNIIAPGSVTATSFLESSLRTLKENIKPFEKSGLDLINELDVVTFDRKDETAKNKIGIIADDSPEEFLSENRDAVDLYKTVFILTKANQELKSEVDELKELVKQLLNKK